MQTNEVKRCTFVVGPFLLFLGVVRLALEYVDVETDISSLTVRLSYRSTNRTTSGNDNKLDASRSLNCTYGLTTFDRTGQVQSAPLSSNNCLESDTDLLAHLVSLSSADLVDPHATAVVIIKLIDRQNNPQTLESLGLVADEFLAPRMDWRIMAERFGVIEESLIQLDENLNSTTTSESQTNNTKPAINRSRSRLLWDPAVYAPAETGTFADPFILAIRTLRATTNMRDISTKKLRSGEKSGTDSSRATDGSSGLDEVSSDVDLILVRVFEEKLAAFAGALRRFQFPKDDQSECAADLEMNQGRAIIQYSGPKDFLGALTYSNANGLASSIEKGFPFARVSPVQWARTYHFETCSAKTVAAFDPNLGVINGFDCGFLPIYGGTCLNNRFNPSLKCISEFSMGLQMNLVLPRNGVPKEVCDTSHEQRPATEKLGSYNSPAQAFVDWCPECVPFENQDKLRPATPELLANASAPMGFEEIQQMNRDLMNMTLRSTCTMEINPLQCGHDGRPCCWNEVSILQNVLGSHDGSAQKLSKEFYRSLFSSYVARFNWASRHRIARLYEPRLAAMIGRGIGWETALATGHCATLHIRRGDNMDRCKQDGPESQWCTMDLTLEDYMKKAVPMLAQLSDARHVFVMTDDPEVVKAEKQAPWLEKGYFIEVISGYNQYSQETYDDWDPFIESLHGAQFCRAFVGHHISTVSTLVYRSICTRWGECPIFDDFSGGR
jgi:hypothetical protein